MRFVQAHIDSRTEKKKRREKNKNKKRPNDQQTFRITSLSCSGKVISLFGGELTGANEAGTRILAGGKTSSL